MNYNYYKLVSLYDEDKDWLLQEYQSGRVRYGWSGLGSDLRKIDKLKKQNKALTDSQDITWRYTQFLYNRLKIGDRLVLQFQKPLKNILIAEITGDYYFADPPDKDFNHIIPCKPLTSKPISVNSKVISQSLKHNLSKRGNYYRIYPEWAIKELNEIIEKKLWENNALLQVRSIDDEEANTNKSIIENTINIISNKWPGKSFENFISIFLKRVSGIEVSEIKDVKKGWDLLIRIMDPLSNEILQDEIPAQCKNYTGEVKTDIPLEDLKRCADNSSSPYIYLFILGNIDNNYLGKIEELEQELSKKHNRKISIKVVTQDIIAEIYTGLRSTS